MRCVIDTHALIWYFDDDAQLGEAACRVLDDDSSSLLIPVMVLVELHYIGCKKGINAQLQQQLAELRQVRNITMLPLQEADLPYIDDDLNIHDAIIVANALSYSARTGEPVRVVTKDERIAADPHTGC